MPDVAFGSRSVGVRDRRPDSVRGHKILFVLPRFSLGGTEMGLFRLLRGLRREDLEIAIACFRRMGPLLPEFEKLGVPIIEFSNSDSVAGKVRRVTELAKFMRREGVRVVENMMGMTAFYGALAAKLAGVPVVISNQRNMEDLVGTPARRMALRIQMRHLSTHVIVNARAIKEWLVSGRYCPPEKIAVIYLGIPVEISEVSPEAVLEERRRLGLSKTDVVIGCVSMLLPMKGLEYLVRAIPGVLRNRPEARFVIVGEGPERRKLERMRRDLNIGHVLLLAGSRSDSANFIAACDICAHPSLSEGLPTAILEYMRGGKPVVGTLVGGVPEAVAPGRSGFLVPPRDPEALVEKLVQLVSDADLRARMGEEGREIVGRRFNINRSIPHYQLIYGELARGRSVDLSRLEPAQIG